MTTNSGGPAQPRNIGIEHSVGKYLAFLDSDDLWLPEKLEMQIELMESSNADISCTSYIRFSVNREEVINVPSIIIFESQLINNDIGNLTAVYNVENLGKYFQDSVRHEDYAMWLVMLKNGATVEVLSQITSRYRTHGDAISSNKFKVFL
jgi:teichuronic acid biosynthesis glycosyltransferase TuaG